MVNECSGSILVLPPAGVDPVLVSCVWPAAGIPQGQDGIVAVTVKGGSAAKSIHFDIKKSGVVCGTTPSLSVPGDLANHVYNVSVPSAACLGAPGAYSMSVAMVIEGALSMCTQAFFSGMKAAWDSRPGDPLWDPKYDLNHNGIIDVGDAAILVDSCPGGFT